MKVMKVFTSLEKLYEKRAELEKQIKELEKKILIDLEKKIIHESSAPKGKAKPASKKPISKKPLERKKASKPPKKI